MRLVPGRCLSVNLPVCLPVCLLRTRSIQSWWYLDHIHSCQVTVSTVVQVCVFFLNLGGGGRVGGWFGGFVGNRRPSARSRPSYGPTGRGSPAARGRSGSATDQRARVSVPILDLSPSSRTYRTPRESTPAVDELLQFESNAIWQKITSFFVFL